MKMYWRDKIMMKLGFIDYYLDEWHANNYPAWIAEASGGDMRVTHAYAVIDSPRGGLSTAAWCEKFGVTRCHSIEEIIAKCDGLIVLSLDDPQMHETLCALPLTAPAQDMTLATMFLQNWDANSDGVVTLDEATSRREDLFKLLPAKQREREGLPVVRHPRAWAARAASSPLSSTIHLTMRRSGSIPSCGPGAWLSVAAPPSETRRWAPCQAN